MMTKAQYQKLVAQAAPSLTSDEVRAVAEDCLRNEKTCAAVDAQGAGAGPAEWGDGYIHQPGNGF